MSESLELAAGEPAVDAEIVDEPATRRDPAPVDQPSAIPERLRIRSATKRPLLAEWMRSAAAAKEVGRWAAGYAGHVVAFHALRLPVYLGRLTLWTPAGLLTTVAAGYRWVFDTEAQPLRVEAVKRQDSDTYLKLARERRLRVRQRLLAVLLVAVLVGAAGLVVLPTLPVWALALAGLAAVTTFGLLGAPRDKPVVSHAVTVDRYTRLTSDMVERALTTLGIAAMSTKGARITFPAPIQRDGPGWRAEVDLPLGVTVTDVAERRERLASGLRRPLGCVWPEVAGEEHPGRLVLFVGDLPMSKTPPVLWPLFKAGQADVFKPVPFMIDQRNRPVGVDLVFQSVLIGAMPRMGKTFALRLLVLAAALDPYVQLRLFELKGTGDLDPLQPVAHRYASGAGDDALEATMDSLREMYVDLEVRAKTITRIAKENRAACPENKVTPELSRNPRWHLGIQVLVIDECQELFSNKEYREEAERLAVAIIKRGPATGSVLVLATQRPDADSLPKSISDNVGIRFALRVMGQVPNDAILGTSSYKNGIRASTFTASDKGVGYLVGVADDPMIGRTYKVDGEAAEKVVERAHAVREAAGTLTGHAVGEEPVTVNVLEDVRMVFATAERLWTVDILDGLARLRPEVYGTWQPEQLAAALRPFGVRSEQVWANGANRQGYALAAIARGQGS